MTDVDEGFSLVEVGSGVSPFLLISPNKTITFEYQCITNANFPCLFLNFAIFSYFWV